jgi:hypothetical protein
MPIPVVPADKPGPRFVLAPGPTIDLDLRAPADDLADNEELLRLLRAALHDLTEATTGSNPFQVLHRIAGQYLDSMPDDLGQVSIDTCFTYGLRLDNAHHQTLSEIAADNLPSMPASISEAVGSAISLHRIIIAGTPRGRRLLELSHQQAAERLDSARAASALKALSVSTEGRPDLFGQSARLRISEAVGEMQRGPHPASSTSEALRTSHNLARAIGKTILLASATLATNVAAQTITVSQPGSELIQISAEFVNSLWRFVMQNREVLLQVVATCGADFYWLSSFLDWAMHTYDKIWRR